MLQELKRQLRSTDEEVRLSAVRGLGTAGDSSVDLLLHALGDESWRVRKEAVQIFLSFAGTSALAGEIVELLHAEENAGLRNAAVEILIGLGKEAIPYLLDELHCNDHDVRKFVVDILGEIGDDSCVMDLVARLNDLDENVRAAAAENLGKLRAQSAVPFLLDALASSDLLLRFTVLEALAQIGSTVELKRLMPLWGEKLLRKGLCDCIGKIGDASTIDLLLTGLADPMRNVREASALALERLCDRFTVVLTGRMKELSGTPTAEVLAEMLESPNDRLRLTAVRLLGRIGDPRYACHLLGLFDEEELRQEAATALIAAGRSAACSLLELWPAAAPRTRAYLAYVFAEAGCEEAVATLNNALTSQDNELRIVSLQALGKLGRESEIEAVAAALDDEEDDVRLAATQSLITLGQRYPRVTTFVLRNQTSSDSPPVRAAAVDVIGRIGDETARPILSLAVRDDSPLVRRVAFRALERLGGEDRRQVMMIALTDEDVEVRRTAAEALGTDGDDDAVVPLSLALQDDDIWVRAAAVRSLGRIGNERSLACVRHALADPVGLVTIAALETLGMFDDGSCLDAVRTVLDHTDEEVVMAALRILAEQPDSLWLDEDFDRLMSHRHWEVRMFTARLLAERQGSASCPLLEQHLLVEGESVVREQLLELLDELKMGKE